MKGENLFEILGAVDDDYITSVHSLTGKDNTNMMHKNKFIKIALIAAVLAAMLSITAGAALNFFLPKGLEDEMSFTSENMLRIIDKGEADENSIKIENKSIDTAGFTVTFEAIVHGKVLRNDFTENLIEGAVTEKPFSEEKTYAVFTLTRNVGGAVFENPDYNNDVNGASIGYIIQLKDYIPNANCFIPEFYFYEDTETNVLYLACDITPALPFAGRELKIAVIGNFVGGMDIVDMDENGYMCNKEGYNSISAIFTLPIDEEYADEEVVNEQMQTGTFITREEYESIIANEENASADEESAENFTIKIYESEDGNIVKVYESEDGSTIIYEETNNEQSVNSMLEFGASIMDKVMDSAD